MVTRSRSSNSRQPNPENNATDKLSDGKTVSEKYGKLIMNNHIVTKDGVKLELGKNCIIEKDYNALYDNEITVKKGDVVQPIKFYDKSWVVIKHVNQHSEEALRGDIEDKSRATDMNQTKAKIAVVAQIQQEGFVPVNCFEKLIIQPKVGSNSTFSDYIKIFIYFFFPVCIGVIGYYLYELWQNGEVKNCCNETCVELLLTNLENRYPVSSNNLWTTLDYCLKKSSDGPCVILLLNGSVKNYRSLLKEIGDLSVKWHKCKAPETDIISLRGSSLTESDSDSFYEDNKCKLEKNKVMLVDELEHIPSSIMTKFHAFCDIYDPAVKQAVIVFLFNHKDLKVDYRNNDATFASELLEELWKDSIHHDIINPLAIRISENIVRLV